MTGIQETGYNDKKVFSSLGLGRDKHKTDSVSFIFEQPRAINWIEREGMITYFA